jgi:hypothetical protein
MEDQLVDLLAKTQLPDQARLQAELDLLHARTNPAFPTSLANVAAHVSIDTAIRQAALSTLRLFIEKNWNAGDREPDQEPQIEIPDASRAHLRQVLLELALSTEDNRKVKVAARYGFSLFVTILDGSEKRLNYGNPSLPHRHPLMFVLTRRPIVTQLARSRHMTFPINGRPFYRPSLG